MEVCDSFVVSIVCWTGDPEAWDGCLATANRLFSFTLLSSIQQHIVMNDHKNLLVCTSYHTDDGVIIGMDLK